MKDKKSKEEEEEEEEVFYHICKICGNWIKYTKKDIDQHCCLFDLRKDYIDPSNEKQ